MEAPISQRRRLRFEQRTVPAGYIHMVLHFRGTSSECDRLVVLEQAGIAMQYPHECRFRAIRGTHVDVFVDPEQLESIQFDLFDAKCGYLRHPGTPRLEARDAYDRQVEERRLAAKRASDWSTLIHAAQRCCTERLEEASSLFEDEAPAAAPTTVFGPEWKHPNFAQ